MPWVSTSFAVPAERVVDESVVRWIDHRREQHAVDRTDRNP
jgi:hypothetical protein